MIIDYMDILGRWTAKFVNGQITDEDYDKFVQLTLWRDNDKRRAKTIREERGLIKELNETEMM